jgi:hypothetical protein
MTYSMEEFREGGKKLRHLNRKNPALAYILFFLLTFLSPSLDRKPAK